MEKNDKKVWIERKKNKKYPLKNPRIFIMVGIKLWCIFCVKMAEEDKNNNKKGYTSTIDENVE